MIVVFEADTHPHNISSVQEFFEFDHYTLGTMLEEYLGVWCDANENIIKSSAHWYRIEITSGSDRFE